VTELLRELEQSRETMEMLYLAICEQKVEPVPSYPEQEALLERVVTRLIESYVLERTIRGVRAILELTR
jgi:hypothetical protein